MFELKLDEKQLEKFQGLLKISPLLAKQVVVDSLKKSVALTKKLEKAHIESIYTFEKSLLGASALKSSVKGGEATLSASSKRNKLQNFDISVKTPKKSKKNIEATISKKNGTKVMKTMFWAFYKKAGRYNAGLFIRNGEERYKISPIATVSVGQMSKEVDEEIIKKIFDIFYKEFDKKLSEEIS